jgi:hypothetical protein
MLCAERAGASKPEETTMMRWSRLAGLCSLFFSCLAVVACDDSEDRVDSSGGTGNDEAGKSAGGKSGSATAGKASGGSNEAGTFTTAGTGFGESGSGGSGGTSGGMAGSGGVPTCATNCNDNNPCTDDACEAGDICVHRDNTADCDDDNACTSDDVCNAGVCKGLNNTDPCDDENACTSNDACANGRCYGTNNTDTCNDGNECTSNDACLDGECQGTNLSTGTCNDLSACTTGDQCWNGQCIGTRDLAECPLCNVVGNKIQNCDFTQGSDYWLPGFFDGGSGTHEVLNERLVISIIDGGGFHYSIQPRQEPLSLKQGMKYRLRLVAAASVARKFVVSLTLATTPYTVFTPGDTVAEDGYNVNVTTEMQAFEWEFIVTEPDSDNVKLELKMGGPGTNGNILYVDDVYLSEVKCTANPDCNDGNECTDDTCNVTTGICTSTNRTGACTPDEEVCTSDLCVDGACTHTPLDGDEPCTSDGDDCTDDVCQAGECVNEFNNMLCNCQMDEHCVDTNPCTDAHCNNGTCEFPPNNAACDDGVACTIDDVCSAGDCAGVASDLACDNDVCTVQTSCGGSFCSEPTNMCFDCTVGGNLLTNCDMSNGATGWLEGFFGGAGTQMVINGMLEINITGAGTEVWQVQPRQEGLELTEGTTYVVRFNAYASITRPIIVTMTQNGGGFVSYSGPRTFTLTPEMQLISFEFTMNAPPPGEKVKFEFDLGDDSQNPTVPNTVYLDNLFIGPKP